MSTRFIPYLLRLSHPAPLNRDSAIESEKYHWTTFDKYSFADLPLPPLATLFPFEQCPLSLNARGEYD